MNQVDNLSGELVFGLMSGTSGDGLDLAACRFEKGEGSFDLYELVSCRTYTFPDSIKQKLKGLTACSGRELHALHIAFGDFSALCVNSFIKETGLKPDLLSSHGHTVFHQPEAGYTLQIGSGASLAALTGVDTVSDFRQIDVSLGGQGAPLVPLGDRQLFHQWDYCLNLGGFANITNNRDIPVKAFDICAVNLVLNYLAQKLELDYDAGGRMAAGGAICPELLERLNQIEYYRLSPPKSLGTEWLNQEIMPLIGQYEENCTTENLLHTYTEHIAIQIGKILGGREKNMLITGGGSWNTYLIDRIRKYFPGEIVIPREDLVNFKEALIFAYLGWLRKQERINVLSSVTGAARDSVSGAIYIGTL